MIECPECHKASSIDAWNRATRKAYNFPDEPGDMIIPLEEKDFDEAGIISKKNESHDCY